MYAYVCLYFLPLLLLFLAIWLVLPQIINKRIVIVVVIDNAVRVVVRQDSPDGKQQQPVIGRICETGEE